MKVITFSDTTMPSSQLKWTATIGKSKLLSSAPTLFKNYNLCQSNGKYLLQEKTCPVFTLEKNPSLQLKITAKSVMVPKIAVSMYILIAILRLLKKIQNMSSVQI